MSAIPLLVIGVVAAWFLLTRNPAPPSVTTTQSQPSGAPSGIMWMNPQFGVNTEGPALHPDLPAASSTPIVVPTPSNIPITGNPADRTSGGLMTQADPPAPAPAVYNSPGTTADALKPSPGGVDTLLMTGTRSGDGSSYQVFQRPDGSTYTV